MGLFSGGGLLGDIGGFVGINTSKQEKALDKATGAQLAAGQRGIEGLEGAVGEVRPFLDPIAEQVGEFLPGVASSATAEGFGSNIADLLSGGALQPLMDERQRASQFALSSAGLTRSGAASEEAARIPTELLLAIESLLSGRQSDLVSQGQGAGINIANLLRGTAQDVANIESGQGAAQSQNILGQQQLKTNRNENISEIAGAAATPFGGLSGIAGKLSGLLGGLF